MKKKYGFMMLMIGLIMGLIFCFSSGLQGVARAEDAVNGSGIYIESGSYTFDGGTISGKTGNASSPMSGGGGGAHIYGEESTFNMLDGTISNNAPYGVCVEQGATFTMENGKILSNASGGVVAATNSSFIMNDGEISNNGESGAMMFGAGFGVLAYQGNFDMNNGKISNNSSGVLVLGGNFEMKKGTISDNITTTDGMSGGGVTIAVGNFTMSDGLITGNSCPYYGGGVRVASMNGSFTMDGGIITGNSSDYSAGGVYVEGGTFTMNGGTIEENGENHEVGVSDGGMFIMKGGTINGNVLVDYYGGFEYSGGIINGEISFVDDTEKTFVISHELECTLKIDIINPPDGKIAQLVGLDTIDLSKIKLTNYPDAQLSIREIDGEKWVVMGQDYTVTIGGGYYTIVKVPYKNYSDIPADVRKQAVETIEFQVPEGTTVIIADELYVDNFQIGDEYVHTVSGTKKLGSGDYFYKWYLYDDKDKMITNFPYAIKSNVTIKQSVSNEPRHQGEIVAVLPDNHPEHKEKSSEYYVENKRQIVKHESQRKSREV